MANDRPVFPRVPERNWWVLRDQFAKTLPKEVTVGYLKTLLQIGEKAAQNLLPPLRQLGLLDDDDQPTDLANNWRNDAKYADACAEMLKLYPQELRDLYSGTNVEKSTLKDWFQYTAKLGEGTASQAASLYKLLLDATPKSSTEFTAPKSSSSSTPKKKQSIPATSPTPETQQETAAHAEEPEREPLARMPIATPKDEGDWFSLHIDLQIHISPEASAEQIDNIFASMAKHIMSMKRNGQDVHDQS